MQNVGNYRVAVELISIIYQWSKTINIKFNSHHFCPHHPFAICIWEKYLWDPNDVVSLHLAGDNSNDENSDNDEELIEYFESDDDLDNERTTSDDESITVTGASIVAWQRNI